jgi:hypothetical protein
MTDEEEKKGFTVRDRRFSTQPEQPVEPGKKETKTESASGDKDAEEPEGTEFSMPSSLPEIDFSSFVFSLSTSALCHLGEVPDPIMKKIEKNLPLAKQTIDILGMLQEKTRGNLAPEEARMLESILADLRWRYVREIKG